MPEEIFRINICTDLWVATCCFLSFKDYFLGLFLPLFRGQLKTWQERGGVTCSKWAADRSRTSGRCTSVSSFHCLVFSSALEIKGITTVKTVTVKLYLTLCWLDLGCGGHAGWTVGPIHEDHGPTTIHCPPIKQQYPGKCIGTDTLLCLAACAYHIMIIFS